MKKGHKAARLSLLTVLFTFSILTLESKGQCVQCTPAPPGWMCTGTTAGGGGCITKGLECTVIDTCFYNGGDFRAGAESQCSPKALGYSLVNVPDGMIRAIGRINPQAAIALINIRDIKLEFKEGKVNLLPLEFTAEDVEKHLTLSESSAYFEEQKAKAREAFAQKQEPIVYEFHLSSDDDANAYSLRLGVVNPAGSSSSFEIVLSKKAAGRGLLKSVRFDATSWLAN